MDITSKWNNDLLSLHGVITPPTPNPELNKVGYYFILHMVRLGLNKDIIFKLIYESMPQASLYEAQQILPREVFQEIKFILLDYIEMVSANIFTVDKISIPDIPSVEL